jgi:hypothetical protein
MKLVPLELIIILHSLVWAIFTPQYLSCADISRHRGHSYGDGSGGGGSGSDSESRPGTRAYYRKKGYDDYSGTPSLANLREQTKALKRDLGTGIPVPKKETTKRTFITYNALVQVIEYTQADGTKLKQLEVSPDLFSTYYAKPQSERNGEKDFPPNIRLVNPYSDTYQRLTECYKDISLLSATSSIDPILIDTFTAQFKETGKTQAPSFSTTWLKELREKYKRAGPVDDTKRTISAIDGPTELPPAHRSRTTDQLPTISRTVSTADISMAGPPPTPIIAVSVRPPYELATAANTMARLQAFKRLQPISMRRANDRAARARKT